jgi:putative membrane protein
MVARMIPGRSDSKKRWATWYQSLAINDALALERTYLAAERTFLAHVRTALAIAISGLSASQILTDYRWVVGGYIAASVGGSMVLVALYYYRQSQLDLDELASRAAFEAERRKAASASAPR